MKQGIIYMMLKVLPLWVCWVLAKTGLLHLFTDAFRKEYGERSAYEVVCSLTQDKDLRVAIQ